MLRQIALQVTTDNKLQDAARAYGTKLSVVDCKPFNKTGISLLLELRGSPKQVHATTADLRKSEGVRQVLEGEGQGDQTSLLVVMNRPRICRVSDGAAIVCLDCPLNSETQPLSWRFIARSANDFRRITAGLSKVGIETKLEDVAPLERRAALTGRQKEIIATAVAQGYLVPPEDKPHGPQRTCWGQAVHPQ